MTQQPAALGRAWHDYLKLAEARPEQFRQSPELEIVFDEGEVMAYQARTGRTIGLVYESPYSMMLVDLVRDRGGATFAYERVVPASTGAGIVVVPRFEGNYLLLRQYRHSMRDYQYAFPRGYGEDGYSAEENARKELREELGAEAHDLAHVGTVVANSGISGEPIEVMSCTVDAFERKVDYEGIVGVVSLSPEELRSWIAENRIDDGFTLAAWALIQQR